MQQKLLIQSCKKKSVEMLKQRKLWFPLSLLFALLMFSTLGFASLALCLERALQIPYAFGQYALCVTLFAVLFLLIPLWRGIHMLFLHELLFERTEQELLFYCYSHKHRYAFAVRRGMRKIASIAVCAFVLFAVGGLGLQVAKHLLYTGRDIASLLVLSLTVLFLFLVLFFYSAFCSTEFLWDAAFLSAPLLSYSQLRTVSSRRIRMENDTLRRFRRSFYPLWLLSVLLLGIPLAVFLPYYVGAKAHLAVALIQD